MHNFLLAPFLSLFSPKFYRRLLTLPQTLGFLYLAYLSLLLSVWALFMFRTYSLPIADDLIGWLGKELPEMVITQTGIQMKIKEPLLLTHPRWGPLVYLDPTQDSPRLDDLETAFLIVTRTKMSYQDPNTGESRIVNLIPKGEQRGWRDAAITGDTVLKFWRRLKPFVASIFFIAAFLVFYLWKLLAGLCYSLIGLILNRFRNEKLRYPSLLNLTFFALTPVAILQPLAWTLTKWRIPLNLLTGFLLTSIYLALAILWTQERRPAAE